MSNNIKRIETVWQGPRTGERLHMVDGSIWFHPFTGKGPICERKSDKVIAARI